MIIHLGAIAMGFTACAIGFAAMFFPKLASRKFGIETEGTGLAFVTATGARDVFLGLVVLILLRRGDAETLAYVSFMIAFVALTDFSVTFRRRSPYCILHFGGAILSVVYGGLLLKFGLN